MARVAGGTPCRAHAATGAHNEPRRFHVRTGARSVPRLLAAADLHALGASQVGQAAPPASIPESVYRASERVWWANALALQIATWSTVAVLTGALAALVWLVRSLGQRARARLGPRACGIERACALWARRDPVAAARSTRACRRQCWRHYWFSSLEQLW